MEKRYIDESRYRKSTSRKRRDSRTVKSNLKYKREAEFTNRNESQQLKSKVIKPKKKIKSKTKKKSKHSKLGNIIICVILLVIIAVISRAILKDENEPFIAFPFLEESNEEIISIGIITDENLLSNTTKNSVINEINKYSKDRLLEINEDYSITYKCLSDVTKVSNSEYVLTRNSKSKVTINDIKDELEKYRKDEGTLYYQPLSVIDKITIVDKNTINIKLKEESPYFIYNLDICLSTAKDVTNYVQDNSSNSNKFIFNRHDDADKQLPAKVIVIKYSNMYDAVEAYKNKEINMFVTNAENVTNILGKYEYNIKTYRNGKTVFMFANPNSKIYEKEEVRKAVAYSIDRDGIIKDVLKSKGQKIDLPYIYDNVKYKYDVYAAENMLLTNGYKKVNKVYSKTENGVKLRLELDLIVNEEDEIKISIANKIKNNLNAIGIKVNVEKLTQAQIEKRIKKGTYDLILASVDLNNNPNISFVNNNLYITDNIKDAMNNVNNSTIQNISQAIISLQDALSYNVSAIGIYSDVSYLVYSKDVIGIEDIIYLNLFDGILK